ncbi:MAG: type II secretion system protein [Candidatus Kerfeldbacteria bacterium]|nr:type II secretion system protein [Candidatus Kerfeldbacteria bacterium]
MIRRPGQTLVEVLLSLAIILIGLLSLTSALINTQLTASTAVEESVAIQLGREGVEAARFIRDRNWLEREDGSGTAFNVGLESDGTIEADDYTAIYTWNPPQSNPTSAISFSFLPDTSDTSAIVYQSPIGLYRQTSSTIIPGGWTATIYSRFITLYPICSNDAGLTETVITSDAQDCVKTHSSLEIGVQVEVTVTWSSRGTSHTRVITERLYDWRYAQS